MLVYNLLHLVDEIKYRATGEWWLSDRGFVALVYIYKWAQYFWLSGSLWMSFSVFIQIYKLLTANKQTKRYQPPTRKRVIRDSTIILIISGVVAAPITVLWWVYNNEDTWLDREYNIIRWTGYIPVLFIPTLLITGMCIGVWRNKLLPRKNARYRSLTMFFARLLASAYLMAIGYSIEISSWYWPTNSDKALTMWMYSKSILYLFGLFQVCLALTKKDIRDAFVDMWCCCRRNGVTRSSTTSGRTARPTGEESYEPEADDYDVEPSTGNDVTALVENSASVENSSIPKEDIHPNENDDNEANTSAFVESVDLNEGTVMEDGGDAMLEGTVVEDVDDGIAVVTM